MARLDHQTIAGQTVAAVLAAAIREAIGPDGPDQPQRVNDVLGVLDRLTRHPGELPAAIRVLRRIATEREPQ